MKARILICIAAAAVLTAFGSSAKKGSCIKKAISLKSSQTAKLVEEYDSEEKELIGGGVAYYTMTLKRGVAYTVWISGGNAENIDLDVGTHETYYDDREDEPSASFDVDEIDDGALKVAYLYADDWDTDAEGDPKSGKYQVMLTGEVNASTQLGFTTGIRTFTRVGSPESPKVLSMATALRTFSGKLVDGEYHFRASLKAGRKYRIRTMLGTAAAPLDISVDGLDEEADPGESTDLARLVNTNNDALILVPDTSGKYEFVVSGDPAQSFKFQYQMVPTRGIAAHPSIPLLEENDYTAKFVPGRIANTQNYYDAIIDEHLCKIYLNKGERWTFETEGATNAIEMIAYNSLGTVLARNESIDGDSYDTRVVITAPTAGIYYVGVCDPALEVETEPTGAPIVLTARNTAGFVPVDAFDPVDDVYATASKVAPYPATTNDAAVTYTLEREDAVELGSIHGPHRLDAADIYDVFAFPCRRGYTYKLRAAFADTNEVSKLVLGAKLFDIPNGKERNIKYEGTISPNYGEAVLEQDLTFKATTDAMHYLRVWVEDGAGLDFPAYNLHVIGTKGTNANEVGLVRVVSKGAPGTWTLGNEKLAYPSGATLTVLPNNALTVRANAVSGFTTPSNTVVSIPAWEEGASLVVVTNVYSDIYDAKYVMSYTTKKVNNTTKKIANYSPVDGDATAKGAFAIVPAAAVKKVSRTLWTNDPADYFSFSALTNVYYNFKIESTLADGSGDAAFMISNATVGVVYPYTNEIARALLPVGVNYVIVAHGTDEKADSAYSLSFSRAAGGIVRFTNAKGTAAVSSFSVKEGTAAATLYVQRTGTEGAMRVRYATQAGTAIPGTNYYPVTDGELYWPAGNKAVKAVKINLVPDAMAQWEASNKVFTVRLYPVDASEGSELEDGEYLPRIAGDTATVTIVESSPKKPGTISLAAYGDADTAVPNVKKPVATGTAGQPLKLTFTRTGGTDGPVSIRVVSPTLVVARKNKDTAFAGTDYAAFDQVLTWEEGDGEPQTLLVDLLENKNYTLSKKFVFTIAAARTDGRTLPALAAKTATLTILNDTVAQTAAAYAKTIPAATGLKLASTGTWFNDDTGTFRSGAANGTLTYTLTGPGLFACEPEVVTSDPADAATLTCQFINKTAKLNESVTDFSSRLVRIIPAGITTVKFTLSGVKGGAYVKFTPQAGGAPYVWGRFAEVTSAAWSKAGMPALLDKAVVKSSDVQTLAWNLPAALAAEPGLYCRVRFGTTAKPTEVRWYDKDHNEATQAEDFIPEVGKTYYWALDYTYTDAAFPAEDAARQALPWTPGPATWSFSTLKDGAPVTSIAAGTDAAGNAVADLVGAGQPVELIQCVKPDLSLWGTTEDYTSKMTNKFRLVAGSLPKGVTINAATGVLGGAPTTPGTYTALLQSYKQTATTTTKTVNGKKKSVTTYSYLYGSTVPVMFNVLPAGTMIGTFRGVLQTTEGELDLDARRLGLLTLTTTAAGKITAKVTIGGIAYTFSGAAGFDELVERDEDLPGCTRQAQVTLKTTVKTLNSKKKVTGTYTENFLTLQLGDGALTNAVALAEAAGTAKLTLSVLNSAKTAVLENVPYTANLYRNNGVTELGSAALASYEGYYTAALAPEGVSAADGIPAGNGYLTFTVAKNGTVKVAGSLADGTAVSLSTTGHLVGSAPGDSLDAPKDCTLVVPVYAGTAAYAFGGEVNIKFPAEDEYPVVLTSAKLQWERNASKLTSLDGSAFAISLAPAGGWYDKVINLQNYYLNREFVVSSIDSGDDLPDAALVNGYTFSTLSSPNDLEASFVGNSLTVPTRGLVKNKTTGLYDFNASVNPWNTTVKFVRATGLVSGTLNAWEWVVGNDLTNSFNTAQREIKSLAHRGVLLYTREEDSAESLAPNVLTAGYFLMPATTSTKAATIKAVWKASLPFNILTVSDDEKIWDEKEFDDNEGNE